MFSEVAPPPEMAPWVAIQRNRKSGSGRRRHELSELIIHLRRCGLRPRLFTDRERMRRRLDDPRFRESLVCIVAAGGDGTVGDVINRFPGLPVAILPLGTENLLARYLHIPPSGREVAHIIAAGRTRRFDVGTLGERRFGIMASIGFDADVVHRADACRRGNITKWNYLQPIWESLRKYKYPPLRAFIDGSAVPVTARLAVVVNLPVYALGLKIAASAEGDDGWLDLRLFQHGSAFQILRYFYNVAAGTHETLKDVYTVRAKCVRFEADFPIPVQVDGDPAGWTPAEVKVLPRSLELFVPPEDNRTV